MEVLRPFLPLTLVLTTVGAAIMAGLLFAFSNFVMRALAQLPPAAGMDAMQRINVLIINPLFLLVFMGTALGALVLLLGAMPYRGSAQRVLLCGSLCYLVGVIGVTAACNVPLNNVLAATPAAAAVRVCLAALEPYSHRVRRGRRGLPCWERPNAVVARLRLLTPSPALDSSARSRTTTCSRQRPRVAQGDLALVAVEDQVRLSTLHAKRTEVLAESFTLLVADGPHTTLTTRAVNHPHEEASWSPTIHPSRPTPGKWPATWPYVPGPSSRSSSRPLASAWPSTIGLSTFPGQMRFSMQRCCSVVWARSTASTPRQGSGSLADTHSSLDLSSSSLPVLWLDQ